MARGLTAGTPLHLIDKQSLWLGDPLDHKPQSRCFTGSALLVPVKKKRSVQRGLTHLAGSAYTGDRLMCPFFAEKSHLFPHPLLHYVVIPKGVFMRRSTSIIRRSATASVFVLAASLLNVTTAHAVVPSWEPGGYIPTCDLVQTLTATPDFQYEDSTKPTIVSFTRVPVVRIGIVPKTVDIFSMRAKDSCSGVAVVAAEVLGPSGAKFSLNSVPTSGTVHNAVLTYRAPVDPATITFGKITYLTALAVDQYDAFSLTPPFTTPTATTAAGLAKLSSSQINYGQVTYIARDTRMTNSASRTRVRSGRTVVFSGKFSVADVSSYYGEASVPIKLQRRFKGAKTWRTIATKNTGGIFADGTIGNISFAVKPTRSAYYRMVFTGALRAPMWEASVVSASKLVTVT